MGKRLRRRALALGLLAVPIAAGAQSSTALDFVKSIYEPYKQAGFKGQPYWETERFFVRDLAEAIKRDFQEAKKRNEPPTLNGDPFVDAQDWDIPTMDYAGSTTGKGVIVVTLRNLGRSTKLSVFTVETPQGWRINDIVGGRGTSLRILLKVR